MHHNKNIVKKPPILYQTKMVKFSDGQMLELNRRQRRQTGIYGDNVKSKFQFKESMV